MGGAALLVEVADTDAALALRAHLASLVERATGVWEGVDHLVAGARTVLVVLRDPGRRSDVGRACLDEAAGLSVAITPPDGGAEVVVEIRVHYDGPDLDEVAHLTGLTRDEVVRAHTGTPWRVGFGGFAPGFAYLVDGDARLRVPRRSEPRTRVPAGSVALAGDFSGIYPQDSPGGWQLIGTTEAVLWDVDRDPPALLAPGTPVRFVDAGQTASSDLVAQPAPSVAGTDATASPLDGVVGEGGDVGVDAGSARRGLEVLATGPLTLVEDLGRPDLADAGVGRSGAADPTAYVLGLRLVGHLLDPHEPGGPTPASLEVTLGGLSVRARGDLLVALTGARCPADVDGRPVPHGAPVALADGAVLTLGVPAAGLRTWLAVRGGIAVAPVLGSRATDTLARVGPPLPVVGDVLPIGPSPATFPVVEVAPQPSLTDGEVVLDVVPGPRGDWCDLTAVGKTSWAVSSRSNRVGIRLEGKAIQRRSAYADRELPSEGMVPGAVQVPPGGEPVVFLADHPVTGGYPVVAVLTPRAVALAAQLRPGQQVRLRWSRGD
ncbi:carboxyltransferase domain-containing protein [Terracoccus sp. 273MFTsu3.1]|uniref:5-oxoprolinase subunit B/C family protein n=1 Tax=Terracoccus sp. 273MFTsu3.1 TaxID=1172188 RepID=UPI0005B8A117|nr:carboxyltransferase domain-containing protein [Terracoccus sp. 273MFTsu3.1]